MAIGFKAQPIKLFFLGSPISGSGLQGWPTGLAGESAGLHHRPQDTSVACRGVFQELTCFVRPQEKAGQQHKHHVELVMLSYVT